MRQPPPPGTSLEAPKPPARARLSWLVDAGCLALLIVTSWKLLHGLERGVDLTMWDEADYLRRGLTLSWSHLPAAEWGPLYSLWYTALSRLWPEPIALHSANLQVLCVLTSVGAYVFMRRMGARPLLALLGAAVYLLSAAPHVTPRPTLLALLVLELALVVASFLESREEFWAVIATGLLVASFARPEFFLAFLLASALFLGWLVRGAVREHHTWRGRRWTVATGFALGVVLLLQGLGNPFGDTKNRRFYAFCQHFAYQYVQHTHGPEDPWNQCPRVIRSVFGEVDSVGAALRANPEAFLWHVGTNVKSFADASLELFAQGPGDLSATRGPWDLARVERVLLLAALGVLGAGLLWRWRRWRSALAEPRVQRMLWVLALVEVPTLLSALLLMPRKHYLIIQGVFVLALFMLLGSQVDAAAPRHVRRAVGGLLALGLALLTPNLAERLSTETGGAPARQVHLQRVRAIEALGLVEQLPPGEQLPLLEAEGGYDAYLGPRSYYAVLHHTPGVSFDELLREHKVAAILLTDELRRYPRFRDDPLFQSFMANPEDFGFTLLPLGARGEALALLSPGHVEPSRTGLGRR
ncbi:hypothetical protein CYFUS_000253 [Cystobacter fuscus]|uniref:Glycosyltransferase RgtA/B/C/D-like domain-containing protein n=1 Tax=Cystobacter fuscus TaxID=43 RepID=A0A250IV90_9BACT|nr:hypothetical protein [Cystobacter fuscus]ATB34846.1 hypothetical protein CYFUS_000253 [Cystobacter fuscus]